MTNAPEILPVGELLDLAGQRALVTGASGNIGRGIALRLAEAGAAIAVHFNCDAAGAKRTVDEITAAGGTALLVQADLSSEAQANDMLMQLEKNNFGVTLAVSNAAVQPVRPLGEMEGGDWRAMMAANLDSAFYVTQAMVRQLRQRGERGALVNVASIEGLDPATGHGHYAVSKAALLMLTRAVALEYGREGIRCNAVSPGLIDRDGLSAAWPDGVARWQDKVPLGRMGTAADVADAVLFLLCPAARWISGANLVVDGGISALPRW